MPAPVVATLFIGGPLHATELDVAVTRHELIHEPPDGRVTRYVRQAFDAVDPRLTYRRSLFAPANWTRQEVKDHLANWLIERWVKEVRA